jgi:phosphopantetheinyl transferase (holo-ACP synthase)
MVYIGNDIVDLTVAGDKRHHMRFLQRVFTEYEQRVIRDAPLPEQFLWCLWAGKETAFKIISKITGPPVFAHRRFVHDLFDYTLQDDGTFAAQGQVNYDVYEVAVEYQAGQQVIHAVGRMPCEQPEEEMRFVADYRRKESPPAHGQHDFSAEELQSIRFPEAAEVHTLCKRGISSQTGIALPRLQVIRPQQRFSSGPPYLLVDGHRCRIDISLAHHGGWLAWAGAIPFAWSDEHRDDQHAGKT